MEPSAILIPISSPTSRAISKSRAVSRVRSIGRTIDSSTNLEGRASQARLQSTDHLCNSRRFFVVGDSDIDVHGRFGGHNIHASSALYQSNGNACASTRVGQALKPEHLMSDLFDRIDAFRKIDTCVGCATRRLDRETPNTLSGCLQSAAGQ